jgi:chaperonin GroEL
VALIRAEESIDVDNLGLSGDEATGATIVRRSLEEPAKLIADQRRLRGGRRGPRNPRRVEWRGLQRSHCEWGDLRKAGIIDPAKVTRSALQNAASIAALVLTTDCAIVEKQDEDAQGPSGYPQM